MKGMIALKSRALWLLAIMLLLGGCASDEEMGGGEVSPLVMADNEILSFRPIERDKMIITLNVSYNMTASGYEQAIEERFPDVDMVYVFHHSAELKRTLAEQMAHNDLEDIILLNPASVAVVGSADAFVDFSGSSVTENYYISSLKDAAVQGKLYYLPGPSQYMGIVYDRTLFAENGWEIPCGIDEFIALCHTIEETGIRALQPSFWYNSSMQQFFCGFAYANALGGVENERWLKDYVSGKGSMIGHMDETFQTIERLIDEGIIRAQDWEVMPSTRSRMLYNDHTCAMIFENHQAPVYAADSYSDHEYGMLPYWNSNDPDSDYLLTNPEYYIAVNKELEREENKAKYDKVIEIIRFISTPEGQEAIISSDVALISNIKGVEMKRTSFTENIMDTFKKGNIGPYVNFLPTNADNNILVTQLREGIRKMAVGEMTAYEVMQSCDQARDAYCAQTGKAAETVIGQAQTTFTALEWSGYLADVMRESTGADFAICMTGDTWYGNVEKLYSGDITEEMIRNLDILIDGSHTEGTGQLVKAVMKGADIIKAIENPYLNFRPFSSMYLTPYFVPSGLCIEFAPWEDKEDRVLNITLPDGSAIQPDKEYTLAFISGLVDEDTIIRQKVYTDDMVSLTIDKIKKEEVIAPFDDGRFTIRWDVIS